MATPDEVSITATEATVAGSSVAATEAEEDAASFSQSTGGGGNEGKVVFTKSDSLDISIAGTNKEDEEEEEDGEYTAPMHLHALRTPAKLKGARSRSSSRSRPGSRRNSASPPRGVGGELSIPSGGISPSVSVESSLDGVSHTSGGDNIIDPDVLLDKLGFRDLDPNVTTEELQEMLRKHISSNSSLPTLNERMSEETMDDSHAFQDLQYVKKTSSGGKKKEDVSGDDDSVEKDRRGSWAKEKGLSSSAVMSSTNYMGALDEVIEEEGEDDFGASDNNIVLEIPDGIVHVKSRGKRSTMNSTTAIGGGASSLDGDDDDEDAEVDVPTAVMNELKVSDGRRMFKHVESSMAVAGSEPDYLEADEQDGLEADLSDTDR